MEIEYTHKDIKKIIIKSQHCQRNWDLSKQIPKEDLDLIIYSVTQCPSKQNHAFYKVYAIKNRDIIEQIHKNTEGFLLPNGEWTTNSQTLANLLLIFEKIDTSKQHKLKSTLYEENSKSLEERDSNMAIGIAAGYANLTASILGYNTGCCACFEGNKIMEILNMKNYPKLIMGIGFNDDSRNRRYHHETNQIFPTKPKETIEVVEIF